MGVSFVLAHVEQRQHMSKDDEPRTRTKSFKDRAREIVRDIVEALEELTAPPPQLIPVPASPRPRRRYR